MQPPPDVAELLATAQARAQDRVKMIDAEIAKLTAERKTITAALGRTRKPRSDKGTRRSRLPADGTAVAR